MGVGWEVNKKNWGRGEFEGDEVGQREGNKTTAKWPKIIIFWIFKCLWNNLIEMLQLGGESGWKCGAFGPQAPAHQKTSL